MDLDCDLDPVCANCVQTLSHPYIECSECRPESVLLCKRCYAIGAEFGRHRNSHGYRVHQLDFPLFPGTDWTAQEEMLLLDALLAHGHGNWRHIAECLPSTRSAGECEEHYQRYYVERAGSELLPKFPETVAGVFPKPVVPYRQRPFGVNEPPRYAPGTLGFDAVSGYNAPRSDFQTLFDADAEAFAAGLASLKEEDGSPFSRLVEETKCALFLAYNKRLQERERRRNVVREHGLLILRKTMSALHRYEYTVPRSISVRLMRYMQLVTGVQFDYIMEGLHRAGELRALLSRLLSFRSKGVRSLEGAKLYVELKRKHAAALKDLRAFKALPQLKLEANSRSAVAMAPTVYQPVRRSQFRPLEIVGLPGYDKLSAKEQELCSTARLVPQTYLELKELLVAENKKFNSLKLQKARKMLKIDVNKTRKLYDFLAEEGFIVKA